MQIGRVTFATLPAQFRAWPLVFMLLLAAAPHTAQAAGPAVACSDPPAYISLFSSPMAPWKGAALRVAVTSETKFDGELSLIAPDGRVAATATERHGGPPWFWRADIAEPQPGKWQARLIKAGDVPCALSVHEISVARGKPSPPAQTAGSVWPMLNSWSRDYESAYSAWIETLFDAPIDDAPSWKALHVVLRDRSRNFLHNHLGLREDEKGIEIKPDCADLPYFLRAYFAFKMGLPFGYAKCTRGGGGRPPRCAQWWNVMKEEPPQVPDGLVEDKAGAAGAFGGLFGKPSQQAIKAQTPPAKPPGLVPAFATYLQTIGDGVHSGSARTMAADDETDYYPVHLSADTLRPGTIYADPYGHILVLAKRVAQSGENAGILLAVDGQPDGTVARKRFWRGNFLFAQDPALGGPGFKRFRPVVRDGAGGLRRLANREVVASRNYGDFSLDPSKLGVEDFYDRMDDVISPEPLDPSRALGEAIAALEEQVKARVTSVENGRKFLLKGGPEVGMPDGPAIFETTGAWEDFATPSRDLRLLIAIDVVRGFPDRVVRRQNRYAMPKDKSANAVKAELDALLAAELAKRTITYTRSDGSAWPLTLRDVIDRSQALEIAYNLNDCVERRWGAAEGSDEASTCRKRASEPQQRKMTEVRPWFQERRRPPRG